MGLIKNAIGSIKGTVKDVANSASGGMMGAFAGASNQALFLEYYASGDMSGDLLMKRGERIGGTGTANTKTDLNVITNGSQIDVQENQCMIIVENGKVVEACMEAGRYTYNTELAPSFIAGDGKFSEKIVSVAKEMWEQAKLGGQRRNTQRVYFINMGILDEPFFWGLGNVPFRHCSRIVDTAPAIRINMMLKANGLAKVRISDPLAFFVSKGAQMAGGDNNGIITLSQLQDTLFAPAKSVVREAIASAVSEIGRQSEVAYTDILSFENAEKFRTIVNQRMEASELAQCGFEFSQFSVNGGFMPREEDMNRLMDMEEKMGTSAFMSSNVQMANYDIQKTIARGFENAGQNGGVTGVMGMGMAMGGGLGSLGNLQPPMQQMPQTQPMVGAAVAADTWQCTCGNTVVGGMFCSQCGSKKPEPKPVGGWTCTCGTHADGNFCPKCGTKKPEGSLVWKCECGKENEGNFCPQCGSKKPEKEKILVCDKCGWSGNLGTKFCPMCGDPITEADLKDKE